MESTPFEFSDAENETIRTLASRMRWVGIFLMAIGVTTGLGSFFSLDEGAAVFAFNVNTLVFLLFAAIFLLTGIWTTTAAKSFSLMAETSGRDIQNLMDALGSLLKLYYMQFWLIVDGLIALLIATLILKGMNLI